MASSAEHLFASYNTKQQDCGVVLTQWRNAVVLSAHDTVTC